MEDAALFCSLTSKAIAIAIRAAKRSVCYAAPGIQHGPAQAMAELARRIGPEFISVCIDFDERVMRMGFGDLAAVEMLRDAKIIVSSTPGLRTGLAIVDDEGYIFTPTALYLESDQRHTDAPNALRLSRDQVKEALARLSPAAKAIAIASAKTDEERDQIKKRAVEIQSVHIADKQRLEEAPPVRFDIARQVRVFSAYLQYVELKLTGAAIQRHRIQIPDSIQKLGGSEDLKGRLKTTFDLIEKSGKLSSKALEDELNDIRKNFTRSLGKDHGRVVLKKAKPAFEDRLKKFHDKLKAHQEKVRKELQSTLDRSRKQIVDYFVPRVKKSPPDAMKGQFLKFDDEAAKSWLESELRRVFPKAETLIKEMQLKKEYKDVTLENLNRADFLTAVKEAYPHINWDRPYNEFRAAGEEKK